MAVTPLNYDDIVNVRWDAFYNGGTGRWKPYGIGQPDIGFGAGSSEIRQVPNAAPYVIKLYEVPELTAPSSVEITLEIGGTALNEVGISDTPGPLEYRVVYPEARNMGDIEFNVAQKGLNVVIKYYGLGHNTSKDSLDTRVPNTGNTTIEGNKTFPDDPIFSGDPTFSGTVTMSSLLDVTGRIIGDLNQYIYDTQTFPTDISIGAVETSRDIYIKKPISAAFGGIGAGSLSIYQNNSTRALVTHGGTATTYGLMLNPGKYRISSGGLGNENYLYVTGVYGHDDDPDSEVVSLTP